jgi:hypothetical protein
MGLQHQTVYKPLGRAALFFLAGNSMTLAFKDVCNQLRRPPTYTTAILDPVKTTPNFVTTEAA